jgi:hypothetical protein
LTTLTALGKINKLSSAPVHGIASTCVLSAGITIIKTGKTIWCLPDLQPSLLTLIEVPAPGGVFVLEERIEPYAGRH